jgi:hypothetical protein
VRQKNIRSATENVATATAHDFANQLAATTRPTHDLLDWAAGPAQGTDDAVGFLPPLDSLRAASARHGQQSRVDGSAAECHADRSASILHQVLAIGNLHSLGCRSRRSLPITSTAIARDDADFRMVRQPSLDRGGLAVGEQVDDPTPFEITDDAGWAPTIRTRASGGPTPGGDEDPIGSDLDIIDQQTGRRQRPKAIPWQASPVQCLPNLAHLHLK